MNWKIVMTSLVAAALMSSAPLALARGQHRHEAAGAVYTMTNASDGNEVVVFDRDDNGMLTMSATVATGGAGSGTTLDPLGSQGSLVLSNNQRWLLAVNAGSNEISLFRVRRDGLELADKVDSGGTFPVSMTVSDGLVYVLNAGGSPNITGFSLSRAGKLTPLADSTRSLGAGGFAQVGFDAMGDNLVVTDKAGNAIQVFTVDGAGLPSASSVTSPSSGLTPFGFVFDQRDHLMVVEAGSNAVSSYSIQDDSTLVTISPSVPNGQKATCWITGAGRTYLFTANPGTHSISAYSKAKDGSLTLVNGAAGMGNTPIDITSVDNGRYLYALDPTSGAIDMFQVADDGSLTNLGSAAAGVALFSQGIAAR